MSFGKTRDLASLILNSCKSKHTGKLLLNPDKSLSGNPTRTQEVKDSLLLTELAPSLAEVLGENEKGMNLLQCESVIINACLCTIKMPHAAASLPKPRPRPSPDLDYEDGLFFSLIKALGWDDDVCGLKPGSGTSWLCDLSGLCIFPLPHFPHLRNGEAGTDFMRIYLQD